MPTTAGRKVTPSCRVPPRTRLTNSHRWAQSPPDGGEVMESPACTTRSRTRLAMAATLLGGCPFEEVSLPGEEVDVDDLWELDQDNGRFRDVHGVVGTDSPTLVGDVDLGGTEVVEAGNESDGFHTQPTDWGLLGFDDTQEAWFLDGDEYVDSSTFLGLDVLG